MATGNTAAAKKAGMEKYLTVCGQRLIPRLARHIYDGDDSSAAKQRVRALLKKGGYNGPGWDDEVRAVKILSETHDMSKLTPASVTGIVERKPPQKRYSLANFKAPDLVTTVVALRDTAEEKLKNVTIILMQAEREIVREFQAGKRKNLGGLAVTVGAALDEIRR